jgi:hypothetical protein
VHVESPSSECSVADTMSEGQHQGSCSFWSRYNTNTNMWDRTETCTKRSRRPGTGAFRRKISR